MRERGGLGAGSGTEVASRLTELPLELVGAPKKGPIAGLSACNHRSAIAGKVSERVT
jgi:hypothetical protein